MAPHLIAACLPLLLIAGLILFQRLLAPMLIAAAWLAAVIGGSAAGSRYFRQMLRSRHRVSHC